MPQQYMERKKKKKKTSRHKCFQGCNRYSILPLHPHDLGWTFLPWSFEMLFPWPWKENKITFLESHSTHRTYIHYPETWLYHWLFTTVWSLICEIRRKRSLEAVMMNKDDAKSRVLRSDTETPPPPLLPVLPASASPYLWEIRIHVLGCDWWIRDKFKELPHSHHGNAMLKKEICQRRCLWGLCEGKGCYSNLFTDRQIKFTITEPRASVSLSQTIRCHGSLPTA